MKKLIYYSVILFAGFACSSHQQNPKSSSAFVLNSKKILETTESYLSGKLTNPTISTDANDIIEIRGSGIQFTVNPYDINIGMLDEDNNDDAIVSYFMVQPGKSPVKKHLIMLNKGKFEVVRDFASDLNVMQISKRIVYGQMPKLSPDAPGYDCKVCKIDVKYKLAGDSLQLIKP